MNSSNLPSTLSERDAEIVLEAELRRRHRARLRAHTETIARWKADFVTFAAELDVIDKSGRRIRVHPTPSLSEFEEGRSGRDITLKPRQVFFTTWELARDLWWLLTQDGSHTVVIAPSDKDSNAIREIVQRANVMLGLDAPGSGVGLVGRYPWLADLLRWERGELRFGAARFEIKGAGASAAAARKVGRAGTIQRLHITEISTFEFASETWGAINPCVLPGGRNEVTIESTPQEASGLFYDLYQGGKEKKNGFRPFFFSWLRHAEYRLPLEPGEKIAARTPREIELVRKYRATASQIKWYRAKVAELGSQAKADQEFPIDEETCWAVAGRLFFDLERTKELLSATTEPRRIEKIASSVPDPSSKNELRVWKEPRGRDLYVVIADPSQGVVDGDPSAATIYHRVSGEHVATISGRWRTYEFASVLDKVGRYFNNALMVVERVNHGHAVLNALLRLGIRDELDEDGEPIPKAPPYPNVYFDEDEQAGWKTSETIRAAAAEALEEAHRTGAWTSPCRLSLAEFQKFIIDKKGKPVAAPGANDDLVLCHVIGWNIVSRPRPLPPSVGSGGSRYGDDDGRGFY